MVKVLGLDIGGANIKYSCGNQSQSIPFELWKSPDQLPNQLTIVKEEFNPVDLIAVTMTGELADCFPSKQAGVDFIATAVSKTFLNTKSVFYQTDGKFVDRAKATQKWLATSSANWHALAKFASRHLPFESGFVFDMGSTTADIIPVSNGAVVAAGVTDVQRLQNGELIYCGVRRTPIAALVDSLEIISGPTPVARELFATVADALIVLKRFAEDDNDHQTADGRSATCNNSTRRLARMICADLDELAEGDVAKIAHQIESALIQIVTTAMQSVIKAHPNIPLNFILSGEGCAATGLMHEIVQRTTQQQVSSCVSLADKIGQAASAAGPAYAVASLASELIHV